MLGSCLLSKKINFANRFVFLFSTNETFAIGLVFGVAVSGVVDGGSG